MDDVLPSELRAVLKLTLGSRTNIAYAVKEAGNTPRSPAFSRIIGAILFSRHFLPSYLVVLVVAVLLYAGLKWLTVRTRARSGKTCLQDNSPLSGSVASSSSSTLQGIESPPLKTGGTTEITPLLAEAQLCSHPQRSPAVRLWHNTRAFLLYQPRAVPALTAPKNSLPANEVSLVILLFLVLNLFYLLYRMPLERSMIFAFADRAGLLFVVNLPVLYILAAKNNQPLCWITGWSYEGLNIFHRRLGEWLTVAALLHAIGMVIGFYQLLAPSGFSLGWYLTRKIIIFGVIGFISYMGIYVTSIGYFRQAWYELFLVLHIFTQVLALVMLFLHHHDARPYVLAAAAIWMLDRGVNRILCKTRSFIATLEIAKDRETVLLYCDVPLSKAWTQRVGIRAGWHAGQHVFLTVPSMSTKHRFQAHPFTIASPAPPRHCNVGVWPMQLTIRAQDGFSRELLDFAKFHQHARIVVDGPYSSDQVLQAVRNSDRVCLIAGGSGIAVTYPFAWARSVESDSAKDIVQDRTLYSNGRKRRPDISMSNHLGDFNFAHFWIRQDLGHESWITMLPSEDKLSLDVATDADPNLRHATDLITHRFETRSATGEHQRPDVQAELRSWVEGDLKHKIDKRQQVCVVVSGPDGLVRDVRNTAASLVRDGWNIDIHVEKFGW